jgi:transcriptional regulator GlxA family with amidase domain
MIRVQFQPGALFRALTTPLYEFSEVAYFDAELVLGREVRDVGEQMAAARSYAEMVALVESYLVRRLRRARQDVHRVDRAASRLMIDPRHASVDWLAAQACLSPRQFSRTFTERMGVGPKLYGRLVRFRHACLFKAAHPATAWPTVAIELGYADYQHMVRDFRQFTNTTPNVWLLEDAASPENTLEHSRTE